VKHERSRALYERAQNVLAGGVSSEFRKFSHPHPLFYSRGQGSRIWDVDGNEYLDFTLSQGPLILGHSHPHVLSRVEDASRRGQLYAGQHLDELTLAETLQVLIPCAELLRFSLSGSESDHAALRLARAATGRPRFIRFEGHYHGWFDNVAVGISAPTLEAAGDRGQPVGHHWTRGLPAHVEDEFILLPYNDPQLLERVIRERSAEIATVILEPVMCNSGCIPPQPGFLETLRDLCDQFGIVLIFDEVVTGFRLGLAGAQGFYGVTPDLAVFGKALGSGYPISVLAGRESLMKHIADGSVIHAGTMNSGNPSIAAALATIEVLESEDVYSRLFANGKRLMSGLETAAAEAGVDVLVQGLGPMFHLAFTNLSSARDYRDVLRFDKAMSARFIAGMQERGIRLIGRGLWYISAAHVNDDIDRALEAASQVFSTLKPEC
jgi:glutamate-1-semialdehyde 2,1-aminomutase